MGNTAHGRFSYLYRDHSDQAMIDNAQKHGVRMICWPEKVLGAFKKAWEEVADEKAAKDAF
jgi:hypothetical protein